MAGWDGVWDLNEDASFLDVGSGYGKVGVSAELSFKHAAFARASIVLSMNSVCHPAAGRLPCQNGHCLPPRHWCRMCCEASGDIDARIAGEGGGRMMGLVW